MVGSDRLRTKGRRFGASDNYPRSVRSRDLQFEHADLLVKAASGAEALSELEKFRLKELYRSHEAFCFFAYLRALSSGGNELLHAQIFAETLREYPAFLLIYKDRDFQFLDNPDRIRFAELGSVELSNPNSWIWS